MSVDDGLPAKAIVSKTPSASEGTQSGRASRDGPGRATLAALIAVQLAWVAALAYGVHRAVELIG
jgi:hypothetical protein